MSTTASYAAGGTGTATKARKHRSGKHRRLTALFMFALVIAVAGGITLLTVFVFPTRQYLEQRNLIEETERVLVQLREETSYLTKQIEQAQSPTAVERSARERLSLVRSGDTLYQLNVDPTDSLRLPDNWPLVGVKHLLGAG